jgi:hypothetical protein
VLRTPQSLRVVDDEDAPIAPRLLSTPAPVVRVDVARVPPDPSMVEFDLTDRELPELSVDSFEELEALDDEELDDEELDDEAPEPPPAPGRTGEVVSLPQAAQDPWASDVPVTPALHAPPSSPSSAPPAPHPRPARDPAGRAAPAPSSILDLPLPPSPVVLLARMGAAFVATLVVTMALILVPWFAMVSPQIDAARAARRLAVAPQGGPTGRDVAAGGVADAVQPPAGYAPAVVEPVPDEPAADEPAADEPSTDEPATDASEPTSETDAPASPPTAAPEKVAVGETEAPKPNTAPPPRPAPRAPSRRTVPKPAAPATVSPPPEPAPLPVVIPRITPEPTAPAPKPPELAPVKARALAGRMAGSAGPQDLSMTVQMRAQGRITASIVRGGTTRSASGTYTMDGNDAVFVLVESGGAATYNGKLTAGGASGRMTTATGDRERFKVRR